MGNRLKRCSGFTDGLVARARSSSLAKMRHSVGFRLLAAVLLFSGCVTLILTAIQLYLDYSRDVSAIDIRLNQIGESYLDSLAEGLWTLDEKQVRLQLNGILRTPDIRYVEVTEASTAANTLFVKVGENSATSTVTREYPLHYKVQGQDKVIGTLRIKASLADAYRRLRDTALTILVSQAAKTFLVSCFILYIFYHLITRHLSAFAAHADKYRIEDTPSEMHLQRRPPRQEDELGRVVTAFNTLAGHAHIAYRELQNVNDQLAMDLAARREAEAELRESEAMVRRLVDANIIGIFIWNFDGRILEANDAFLGIVGYDREDLVSDRISWTDLTPPKWRERDAQWIEENKKTGLRRPIEKEYFRKDGSRVPILVGAANFGKGESQGVAFVLDLTERKGAEEAARRSEKELRDLIETIPAMVWSATPDGHVEYINMRWQEFTGLTLNETLGRHWEAEAPFHPDDFGQYLAKWNESLATGEPFDAEMRIRRASDGEYRWLFESAVPLRDAQGAVLKWYGFVVDIEDRKRVEMALRDSDERWKAVFENNPTMYFILDAAGIILSVNPFGAAQLGYTVDELTGDSVLKIFYDADRADVLRNATKCLGQLGQTMTWELRKVRKDGSLLWVRETAKAMLMKGRPVLLIVCEDITAGKRAAEALREVQSELAHANRVATLGQLTASIAHEVNQPITGVITSGQAALRWLDKPDLEAARRAIERVVRDGARAGDVIHRIRALIQKAPARTESFDMNEAIREVIVITRGEAAKNGISVETQLAKDLPLIEGDRVQLQQVILNLVINAIEAMSGGWEGQRGLLITTTKTETHFVSVAVQDSGPGVDFANQDGVFQVFYTTKPNGLGMGLSICRSIVEGQGGTLAACANAPHGAIFQFSVPSRQGREGCMLPIR